MNPNPPTAASNTTDSNQIVVLMVDDQAMVAEVVRRLLASQTDLSFHYCTNPTEAIALANQIRPTVILQDLVMPGLNGMTMVRRFRGNEITHSTPIVVLSSKEDPIFKQEALTNGANDYLVKLPDPATLQACIRKHAQAFFQQTRGAQSASPNSVAA